MLGAPDRTGPSPLARLVLWFSDVVLSDAVPDCTHDWELWQHRDVAAGAEKCQRCHQVKIVCPRCGNNWEGFQMRASVNGPLLCADCWERELKGRLDDIQQRLGQDHP